MMKVKLQTDTEMVVKSSPIVQMISAVIVLIIGLVVLAGAIKATLDMRLIVGGIMVLFSILVILLTRFRTIAIDKASDSFHITLKSIIGKKNQEFKVSDVDRIEISEQMMRGMPGNQPGFSMGTSTQVQYTSFIMLKNGDQILLSREHPGTGAAQGFGIFLAHSRDRKTDKKIAGFLNIPFVQQTMPTPGETISGAINAFKKPESFVQPEAPQTYQTPPVQQPAPVEQTPPIQQAPQPIQEQTPPIPQTPSDTISQETPPNNNNFQQ
jgi:hypothetical protein